VPSPSLQALLARAGAALDRGRGAEAAQMLTPALRSSALTRDDEFAVRSMLAESVRSEVALIDRRYSRNVIAMAMAHGFQKDDARGRH